MFSREESYLNPFKQKLTSSHSGILIGSSLRTGVLPSPIKNQ